MTKTIIDDVQLNCICWLQRSPHHKSTRFIPKIERYFRTSIILCDMQTIWRHETSLYVVSCCCCSPLCGGKRNHKWKSKMVCLCTHTGSRTWIDCESHIPLDGWKRKRDACSCGTRHKWIVHGKPQKQFCQRRICAFRFKYLYKILKFPHLLAILPLPKSIRTQTRTLRLTWNRLPLTF